MGAVVHRGGELNPKQREVLTTVFQSGRTHCLIYGGGRSGKTFLTVYVILIRALKAPGSTHWIVRKQLKDVRGAVWDDTLPTVCSVMFPGLWEKCAINKTELTMRLPNGSSIMCIGLDDKQRRDSALGKEASTIYLNECSEISYSAVQLIRTRMAKSTEITVGADAGNDLPLRMYYDLNPSGIAHWTFQEWFKARSPDGSKVDPSRYVVAQMNPADNPHLPAETLVEYQSMSGARAERFLHGRYLAEAPGALWTQAVLDATRVAEWSGQLDEVAICCDPSFNRGNATADSVGIGVVARSGDEALILEDRTSPIPLAEWPTLLVDLYFAHQADALVVEDAFGQVATVEALVAAVPATDKRPGGRGVNIVCGPANRGKATRAEPVRMLFDATPAHPRGRCHVVGSAPQFETEATTWVPGERSPNAMDAMVHGVTWVMRRLLGAIDPAGVAFTGTFSPGDTFGLDGLGEITGL